MRQAAVAGTETTGGADRGQLVTAEVHVGLDRAVELPPFDVDVRPKREGLGEVGQVAERLPVGLIHRGHGTRRLVFGNGVDERHASVLSGGCHGWAPVGSDETSGARAITSL